MTSRFAALLLVLLSPHVLAQVDSRPLPEAERTEKLERARLLKGEASQRQKEADAVLKAENDACYKKFQVSSCLDDARKKHTLATRDAKRKELEGDELERDVKRRDVAAKDAKKSSEAPQRAVKQKEQGETYRAEEAAKAQARTDKVAKKEQQAVDGRRKHAEDQARYKKKQESHAKKEAKAAEKRAAREAKAAAKAAEKGAAKAANP